MCGKDISFPTWNDFFRLGLKTGSVFFLPHSIDQSSHRAILDSQGEETDPLSFFFFF